ncbi:MAG: hypothetical protein M3M87_06770 [Thermoproteota archaeon]|nr:hypothetical protein [Thermoproteota archaeon]
MVWNDNPLLTSRKKEIVEDSIIFWTSSGSGDCKIKKKIIEEQIHHSYKNSDSSFFEGILLDWGGE